MDPFHPMCRQTADPNFRLTLNKTIVLILFSTISIGMAADAQAQLLRKAGQYFSGKALRESGKRAAAPTLRKSARDAGKHATRKGLGGASGAIAKGAISPTGRLVASYGDDATRAIAKLSPQNARRMSMLADDIQKSGQGSRLMELIAKGGKADQVVNWLWRNKAAIGGGTLLATFVVNPDPYLDASAEVATSVVETGGEHIVKPMVESVARPIANWLGLTVLVIVLGGFGYLALGRKQPPSQNLS